MNNRTETNSPPILHRQLEPPRDTGSAERIVSTLFFNEGTINIVI